jgi:hypothetical protein
MRTIPNTSKDALTAAQALAERRQVFWGDAVSELLGRRAQHLDN